MIDLSKFESIGVPSSTGIRDMGPTIQFGYTHDHGKIALTHFVIRTGVLTLLARGHEELGYDVRLNRQDKQLLIISPLDRDFSQCPMHKRINGKHHGFKMTYLTSKGIIQELEPMIQPPQVPRNVTFIGEYVKEINAVIFNLKGEQDNPKSDVRDGGVHSDKKPKTDKETIPAQPEEQEEKAAIPADQEESGKKYYAAGEDQKPRICENCGKEFIPFHTEFKKNGRIIVAGDKTCSIECSEELWENNFKREDPKKSRKLERPDMEDWEPVVDELRRIRAEHDWSIATLESVMAGGKRSGSTLAPILRMDMIPPKTSRIYKMILDYLDARGFKHNCR